MHTLNVMRGEGIQQPKAVSKLCRDVEEFKVKAFHAAISMYSISHICTSLYGNRKSQRDIAGTLMAIVGALS